MQSAVTAAQAASGVKPDMYWPSAIRTDSKGAIVLMEHGLGRIRWLDPITNQAINIADVDQNFGQSGFGWAWMDVDTTGAAGNVSNDKKCMPLKRVGSHPACGTLFCRPV